MGLVNSILKFALKKRIHEIDKYRRSPFDAQWTIFRKLIEFARNTEFGRKYQFEKINTFEDYQRLVPISTYEDLFPYIEKCMAGQDHILWPGKIKWFSKSSGTTNAKSKFIPVTAESLHQCHYKGGKDLLSLYFNNCPESRLFDGKGLAIGGTITDNPLNPGSYSGDISAIIMKNLPSWAEFVRTPDIKTALMSEWEEKLEKLARITLKENVTNISGVPTWTIVLLEKILSITGKKNMLEVWPDFEVFFHGGVAFEPYRNIFKKFFPGNKVKYMGTYNASEGFFGIQDTLSSSDLLLLLDYGVFFEFLPMEESEKENPKTLSLQEVEIGKNYALVISTNAGLWRYKIGDTVKFTSLQPYKIRISGRTKHFINAFGEELIIENAEGAISWACSQTGAVINNFTAAPVYFGDEGKAGHEWIIEFQVPPAEVEEFINLLDNKLKDLNSDYEAKRYKDLALQMPTVHAVPPGTFYNWMKKRGKLGGQNKVPRLSNSREYVEDILNDLALAP